MLLLDAIEFVPKDAVNALGRLRISLILRFKVQVQGDCKPPYEMIGDICFSCLKIAPCLEYWIMGPIVNALSVTWSLTCTQIEEIC